MSDAALILFGSLARKDQTDGSDVDLLMISSVSEPQHVTMGPLSLFLYPRFKLERDALDGNLFVCHLVREAKPLFDPREFLAKLRETFQLKPNYQSEIAQALDLGWFLVRFGGELNSALQAKRTLWCIRTILISRSAEKGDPVFAPDDLAKRTTSKAAKELLTRRHERWNDEVLRDNLHLFLQSEVNTSSFHKEAGRESFIERFEQTSNEVALRTLRQADQKIIEYP